MRVVWGSGVVGGNCYCDGGIGGVNGSVKADYCHRR